MRYTTIPAGQLQVGDTVVMHNGDRLVSSISHKHPHVTAMMGEGALRYSYKTRIRIWAR